MDKGPLAEINVTPFVDILLVLLIVFMITAPLLTHSLNIQLPHGNTNEAAQNLRSSPLVVEVDSNNNIYLGEQEYQLEALKSHLQQINDTTKLRPVHLQMDREVTHGFLIQLMLAFKNEGFKEIGLVFIKDEE